VFQAVTESATKVQFSEGKWGYTYYCNL